MRGTNNNPARAPNRKAVFFLRSRFMTGPASKPNTSGGAVQAEKNKSPNRVFSPNSSAKIAPTLQKPDISNVASRLKMKTGQSFLIRSNHT